MTTAQWLVLDNLKQGHPYGVNMARDLADDAYLRCVSDEYIKDGKITGAGTLALTEFEAMIGKVTCRELTPDEVASYCDAWREFCDFMEGHDDEEAAPAYPFYPRMLKKFRAIRDKYNGPFPLGYEKKK